LTVTLRDLSGSCGRATLQTTKENESCALVGNHDRRL